MKIIPILIALFSFHACLAQDDADDWIHHQLGEITWQRTYNGMLADYHPVTVTLASDQKEIAGYFMHKGDQVKHQLFGEWSETRLFQLQERDEHGRLTGYLTGKIKDDQLDLKWISVNQDRIFEIHAVTDKLVKMNNMAPAAEWIAIASDPEMSIAVQKIGQGLVAGIALSADQVVRFQGTCMDGLCSMWKTSFMDDRGQKHHLQMRQNTSTSYKATLNEQSFTASFLYSSPLIIRHQDNSAGFIDFSYPKLQSPVYTEWIEAFWNRGTEKLNEASQLETHPRLAYRSSGWIEIIDETEDYVSGLVTFINPDGGHRESFLLLKKEGEMIKPGELLNAPTDFSRGAELALASADETHDDMFYSWLEEVGYTIMAPTQKGLVMITEFNTIYGDELQMLSIADSKNLIKKKYWKYFGW